MAAIRCGTSEGITRMVKAIRLEKHFLILITVLILRSIFISAIGC